VTRIEIRRARPDDAGFLTELLADEEVRPYLSVRAASILEDVRADVERSDAEPHLYGRYVIELDGERAGTVGFRVTNEPSRIAELGRFAIHPRFRGRRLGDEAARIFQRHLLDELGFHRLELQIYSFNERAIAHAERAGFVREGVKRQAYLRGGEWQDAVQFSLLREDLEDE
jgi:RimJ/RimL family protein N-acetyltransferase